MASSTSSLLNMFTPLIPTKHNFHQNAISISTLNTKSSLTCITNGQKTRHPYGVVVVNAMQNSTTSNEVTKVINPSISNANIMFYKSAYNVQVLVDDNEPEERLLNRFRREVMRAGVIQECKRRRFFENKQDEKKRKSREAAKRNSRRRRGPFQPRENKEDAAKVAKSDDDQDNWEMPAGDSPF